MAQKKYTLFFHGKNKYGHEYDFPIISLDLVKMDELTSNYKNYYDLFKELPYEVKLFIKENLSKDIDLSDEKTFNTSMFIADNDNIRLEDVVFLYDSDVLNVSPEVLSKLLVNELIDKKDFQRLSLKTKSSKNIKKRYNFFKYLYDNYVKGKKVEVMMDLYDTKESFPCLRNDELMIASIATDKDNVIVLAKKLSQSFNTRRTLAFKIKKLHDEFKDDFMIDDLILDDYLMVEDVFEEIVKTTTEFEKKYYEEYEEA